MSAEWQKTGAADDRRVAGHVKAIRLGTRASTLALAQTELVKTALQNLPDCPPLEVRKILTSGDQHLDLSLKESGQSYAKGLFTKELEFALKRGDIDLAVHSLKDLPIDLHPDFLVAAVLPRHDPVDVLISRTPGGLSGLPDRAVIATSSPRRAAQLRFCRRDLQIVEIRGNVNTRLEKLGANPRWSALVLAKAGLERLGLAFTGARPSLGALFWAELHELYPAAGQGTIAIEIASAERALRDWLQQINDRSTWVCVAAEREFLRLINGGCHTPVGIRSRLDGATLTLEAMIIEPDETALRGMVSGSFADSVSAAQALLKSCYESKR